MTPTAYWFVHTRLFYLFVNGMASVWLFWAVLVIFCAAPSEADDKQCNCVTVQTCINIQTTVCNGVVSENPVTCLSCPCGQGTTNLLHGNTYPGCCGLHTDPLCNFQTCASNPSSPLCINGQCAVFMCSNHGICNPSGQCVCDSPYSGTYCQVTPGLPCTNPATGNPTFCLTCPEDQLYAQAGVGEHLDAHSNVILSYWDGTVYCPMDTCTCAAGTGYNNNVASHCNFGYGSMTHFTDPFNRKYQAWMTCSVPARQGICGGHGTELPYNNFPSLPYVVGFWMQGTLLQFEQPPNNVGQYLDGRCVCDNQWYYKGASGINCHDVVPCPPQNGGPPCGGTGTGICTAYGQTSCCQLYDGKNYTSSQCICPTGYGDTHDPPQYCCPRMPGTGKGPNSLNPFNSPICGGRGICTGVCTCNVGYAGQYCCYASPTNPLVACNGKGTCNADGTCSCIGGYSGAACDVNTNCGTNQGGIECSGGGVCKQFTQIEVAVVRANFPAPVARDLDLSPFVCDVTGCHWTMFGWPIPTTTLQVNDGALVAYLMRLYKNAFFTDLSQNNTVEFWLGMQALCGNGATRAACIRNVNTAVVASGDLARALALTRYANGHANVWVSDSLSNLYPNLALFDSTISATIVAGVTATNNQGFQATALAILMGYDTFVNWLDPFLRASIPAIGSWYCECNTVFWMSGGSSYLPGGPSCLSSCISSHVNRLATLPTNRNFHRPSDSTACTGWVEGTFHGICGPDNTCQCSTYWGGPACDISLLGACVDTSIDDAYPCTTATSGQCILTNPQFVGTNTPLVLQCQCTSAWTGLYCQYSKCALANATDSQRRLECSSLGTCEPNGQCSCDVDAQLALSTSSSVKPNLPVGQDCSKNGISACGVFVPSTLNHAIGTWISCSASGTCVYNATTHNSTCVCDAGAFGNVCQFTSCNPDCPDNALCDITTGTCHCLFAYSGTDCSTNRCANGLPSGDGLSCVCDLHWTTDSKGLCTVIQCPLVVYTTTGPRLCKSTDPVCSATEDFTLTPCCYDACEPGHCLLNKTSNSVTCACDPPLAYTQDAGVCYPICNGQPYYILNNKLTCDCSCITPDKSKGQFVDAFCELGTCLNGGTALTGGCQCASGFSDPVCGTPDCLPYGTLDVSGDFCNCIGPAANGNNSVLCGSNTCGPTGAGVVASSTGALQCSCPKGYTTASDGQTCNAVAVVVAASSSGPGTTLASSSSGTVSSPGRSSSTGSPSVLSSSSGTSIRSSSSSSTAANPVSSSSSTAAGHSVSSSGGAGPSSSGLASKSTGAASSTGRLSSTAGSASTGTSSTTTALTATANATEVGLIYWQANDYWVTYISVSFGLVGGFVAIMGIVGIVALSTMTTVATTTTTTATTVAVAATAPTMPMVVTPTVVPVAAPPIVPVPISVPMPSAPVAPLPIAPQPQPQFVYVMQPAPPTAPPLLQPQPQTFVPVNQLTLQPTNVLNRI